MNASMNQSAAKLVLHRRLAGVAGIVVGSLVLAFFTLLFHLESRMPWLAPTEANAQLLARCDRIAATAARQHCVEAVIAAVQSRASAHRLAVVRPPAAPDPAY